MDLEDFSSILSGIFTSILETKESIGKALISSTSERIELKLIEKPPLSLNDGGVSL